MDIDSEINGRIEREIQESYDTIMEDVASLIECKTSDHILSVTNDNWRDMVKAEVDDKLKVFREMTMDDIADDVDILRQRVYVLENPTVWVSVKNIVSRIFVARKPV